MVITKNSLNYVLDIVKYLYFNLELNQEIELSKLSKPTSRDMFIAALDFVIDRDLTLLGGFSIRYTDEHRTAIKKIANLSIKPVQGFTDQKHVMPFEFKNSLNTGFKTSPQSKLSEKYEKLFEYGNT
jgi:hypothetical protein